MRFSSVSMRTGIKGITPEKRQTGGNNWGTPKVNANCSAHVSWRKQKKKSSSKKATRAFRLASQFLLLAVQIISHIL